MSKTNTLTPTDRLDSELLRTFLAVAEAGSFTKGADRIFRSQSAASLHIKQLESVLGQAVFERQARGIALTPVGEKLRPIAQRIVEMLDISIGELKTDALTGSVRIGIPDEYSEAVLADVIARFARDHPRVEITVRCGFSADFPQALVRNEIDIAVYAVQSPPPDVTVLGTEKTLWVSSRHHLVHEQDPLPVALFDRACWWRDHALEALECSGKRYRVVYTSESVMGILAAVSAGIAVGLLGENTIGEGLKILTSADGLPKVADSALVLKSRDDISETIKDAMTEAIVTAFRTCLKT